MKELKTSEKVSKKVIILLFVAAIVIACAVGVRAYLQSSAENNVEQMTSDWKVYSQKVASALQYSPDTLDNDGFGHPTQYIKNSVQAEIKFPKTWSYEPANQEEGAYNLFFSADKEIEGKVIPSMLFWGGGINCSTLYDNLKRKQEKDVSTVKFTKESYSINGLNIEKFLSDNGPEVVNYARYNVDYCVPSSNNLNALMLDFSFSKLPSLTESKELDLIAATLKFPEVSTNELTNVDPSGRDEQRIKHYESKVWNFKFDYDAEFSDPVVVQSIDGNCEAIKLVRYNVPVYIQMASQNYHCAYNQEDLKDNPDIARIFTIGDPFIGEQVEAGWDTGITLSKDNTSMQVSVEKNSAYPNSYRTFAYNTSAGVSPDKLGSMAGENQDKKNVIGFFVYSNHEEVAKEWASDIMQMAKSLETDFTKK